MARVVNPEFWRERRVLVTGHSGFKGAWLALWLQHLGAEVAGYALDPPTVPSLFVQAGVAVGMASRRGDVRDLAALTRAFGEARPEVVFHLAAQSLVREGYRRPVETFATNAMGTAHVLECVRSTGSVKAVVNVTSDKCYAALPDGRACRETDPLGGVDPYSSSKACAEMVTAAYRSAYLAPGTAVATARAGNVIGGCDWAADRLVPDWARAALSGGSLALRSPAAVRPWQHVLEPLAGYLKLAERLHEGGAQYGEGWNFGPPAEGAWSVRCVVERLDVLWREGGGREVASEVAGGPHPHEVARLVLDSDKARARLAWSPRLRLEEALRWTVAGYRVSAESPQGVRAMALRQIEEYESLSPVASEGVG